MTSREDARELSPLIIYLPLHLRLRARARQTLTQSLGVNLTTLLTLTNHNRNHNYWQMLHKALDKSDHMGYQSSPPYSLTSVQ